ncbi:aldo/keto reductase [Nonomuraea sp. NPDC049152]|uniref:aldo/keto reductase n=1 Tax=Nonomuraea sp. NPDC049152 TaxID=3154350 RepID=UPI0033F19AB1
MISALRGFEASLARLRLDYVDLLLIHWPLPVRDLYLDTWRAFIRLQADGLVRSIGVSNFLPHQMERLVTETGVWPVVNQVEIHPYFSQRDLRDWHLKHNVVSQSWSPIGAGMGLLDESTVRRIAGNHGRTPAQVVLRWHLQLGAAPIPKSADAAHEGELRCLRLLSV